MDVDLEQLAAVIESLDKTEFTDFEYKHGDLHIRVRRGGSAESFDAVAPVPSASSGTEAATPSAPQAQPPAPAAVPTPARATASQGGAAAGSPASADDLPADQVVVTAPLLGTFYTRPKPGEDPFVSVGDIVEADSVVSIVEVMKLMNSVPAGVAGEVVAVFASDGEMVEFGQPLFAIRPTSGE